ncbi:MAG TPA: low molecular weight protein-tyrosine-phosphatase [Prolixibacteraceae bacterium]|jgi:protein-tyrosine phosphatase
MIEKHLLFVCLGNICRSPSAEAVMNSKLKSFGWGQKVLCDSAGIIGFHAGEPADARMRKHALRRGYLLTSLSRQVNPDSDFDRFDMIIGMDDQNIKDLNRFARSEDDRRKIFRMTDFSAQKIHNHVPDPYYTGNEGFELVLDILEDACGGLIQHLGKEKGTKLKNEGVNE